jgi:hypothetical protein
LKYTERRAGKGKPKGPKKSKTASPKREKS